MVPQFTHYFAITLQCHSDRLFAVTQLSQFNKWKYDIQWPEVSCIENRFAHILQLPVGVTFGGFVNKMIRAHIILLFQKQQKCCKPCSFSLGIVYARNTLPDMERFAVAQNKNFTFRTGTQQHLNGSQNPSWRSSWITLEKCELNILYLWSRSNYFFKKGPYLFINFLVKAMVFLCIFPTFWNAKKNKKSCCSMFLLFFCSQSKMTITGNE